MQEKKILIGCPTFEKYRYCIDLYLQAVRNINYKNFDLLLVDNSPNDDFYNELKQKGVNIQKIDYCKLARERIVKSRNLIREKAIQGNYDYFFSLEQDVIVKPDILNKLLSSDKKIISAYYGNDLNLTLKDRKTGEIKKAMINVPLVYLKEDGKVRRANPQEVLNKGVIEVGAMGVGCLLIAKEVFEKIKFRYNPEKKAFDDMYFCKDAKELGYKLYVDGNIVAEHLHKKWEGIEK